mgnify:CR=1 FL=1
MGLTGLPGMDRDGCMNNRLILFIVAIFVIMIAGNVLMGVVAHVLNSGIYIRLAASGAMLAGLVYLFLESSLRMLAISGAVGAGVGLLCAFDGLPALHALNMAMVVAMGAFLLVRLALFFYEQWQLAGLTQFFQRLFK